MRVVAVAGRNLGPLLALVTSLDQSWMLVVVVKAMGPVLK